MHLQFWCVARSIMPSTLGPNIVPTFLSSDGRMSQYAIWCKRCRGFCTSHFFELWFRTVHQASIVVSWHRSRPWMTVGSNTAGTLEMNPLQSTVWITRTTPRRSLDMMPCQLTRTDPMGLMLRMMRVRRRCRRWRMDTQALNIYGCVGRARALTGDVTWLVVGRAIAVDMTSSMMLSALQPFAVRLDVGTYVPDGHPTSSDLIPPPPASPFVKHGDPGPPAAHEFHEAQAESETATIDPCVDPDTLLPRPSRRQRRAARRTDELQPGVSHDAKVCHSPQVQRPSKEPVRPKEPGTTGNVSCKPVR